MIAIPQNQFNINLDFDYLQGTHNSTVDYAKSYLTVLKKLYSLRKILKSNLDNLESYLSSKQLYNIGKIDEILIELEELSEFTDEILTHPKFKYWTNYPIWYMTDKLEDANMSLQGMLLSTQSHLSQDKSFRWS